MNDKLLHFFAGSYVALLAMELVQWAFALAIVANLGILKAQAQWINDYGAEHPEQASQVLEQQSANIQLMIEAAKNDTLNPSLQVPPPPPN